MPLPAKTDNPTKENVQLLYDGLTAWIADHPGVDDGCSFYANIDAYLGPWGQKGYPLGYGHFYCVAFGTDPDLQRDAVARQWVRWTRIRLQELLRDIIVTEFRNGRLPALSAEKLTDAAFESHPKAYDEAGLRRVLRLSPKLIGVVFAIPGREFVPFHGSAWATYRQAVVTGLNVGFETIGDVLVNPVNDGENEALDLARLPAALKSLRSAVEQRRADDPILLKLIVRRLSSRAYPDCASQAQALGTIKAAQNRLTYVKSHYAKLIRLAPQTSEQIKDALDHVCGVSFFSCATLPVLDGYQLPGNSIRIPASRAGARSNAPLGQ